MFVRFSVSHRLVSIRVEGRSFPFVSVRVALAPAGSPETLKFTALRISVETLTRLVITMEFEELIGTVARNCDVVKRTHGSICAWAVGTRIANRSAKAAEV